MELIICLCGAWQPFWLNSKTVHPPLLLVEIDREGVSFAGVWNCTVKKFSDKEHLFMSLTFNSRKFLNI